MSIPYALLRRLADGQFHSGESLGAALGISRSAIWKQVQCLSAWHLDVLSVKGRGYRLAHGLNLLEPERIRGAMAEAVDELLVLPEVDSTNRYVLDAVRQGPGRVIACLAEFQSAGRGRRGRVWHSPFAANLYLSLSWTFAEGAGALGGLSLAVGLAVARALESLGMSGVALKWPNDLMAGGAKLGGILIEVSGETGGPCQVIIGVGLNVAMPRESGQGIEQAWIDLRALCKAPPDRNAVAAAVLDGLLAFLPVFERDGFGPFHAAWSERDVFRGAEVRVVLPRGDYVGEWRGVDVDGSGLVWVGSELRRVTAGDVSLRRAS